MLHIAEYGAMLLSELALAADKLSLGCLMHPVEVKRKVSERHLVAPTGRWWLCGNLHPDMFAAAQEQDLRHLGKEMVSFQGIRYLVLAQQIGQWQHRLLLQVAGREVKDFLAQSVNAGFELSLGLAGSDESLLVPECRFVRPLLGEVESNLETHGWSAHELRKDACLMAASLFAPEELTHEELQVPKQVCVSIVSSRELIAAVTGQDNPLR